MLWFHKKQLLKKLKRGYMIKKDYDKLKGTGMLYKLFPEATGDFDKDCDYVFLKEMERGNKVSHKGYRFVDPFDIWSD